MIKKSLKFSILLALITLGSFGFAQDGEKLFKANCASCHKPTEKKLVGPGLAGIEDRWESKDNLIAWIQNSQEYLKTGDPYAVALFEQYNKSIMPAQALSVEEVNAVLDYVKNYVDPSAAPVATGDAGGEAVAEDTTNYTMYWLAGLSLVFLILLNLLLGVKKSVNQLLVETGQAEPEVEMSLGQRIPFWMARNKKLVALMVIAVLGIGAAQAWYALLDVGVYTGYQPAQPIAFSHKIHAGQNGINCVYCHNSAERGKHSGIPTVNVCMNCHTAVQEGKTPAGTAEIAKIHEAAGFNAETGKYDKPEKPIEWIRIHNLPDHVYFNHSQHVVVGKQQCQTCHGPIQEMEEVYQYSPLTMGWCINCHRETNVAMDGNGYYDKMYEQLLEMHEGKTTFTVQDIGGLECAKCHY